MFFNLYVAVMLKPVVVAFTIELRMLLETYAYMCTCVWMFVRVNIDIYMHMYLCRCINI